MKSKTDTPRWCKGSTTDSESVDRRFESSTGKIVKDLIEKGFSTTEIAKTLDMAPATVSYHKKKQGFQIGKEFCKKHSEETWNLVQKGLDEGETVLSLRRKFKISGGAWASAVKRGAIRYREIPIEDHLQTLTSNSAIKKLLFKHGLKSNECSICKQPPVWNGAPLVLQLDHIDGNPYNNRVENLRILCPNCHTQTPTYGRKCRRT